MGKLFFYSFIAAVVFVFASCLKKDENCPYKDIEAKASVSEMQKIEMHLAANNITAQKDSSGVYYTIINAGSGKSPEVCSVISVNYTGTLTNGQVFDKSDGIPITFRLGELIAGWQKGLPHIKAGGKMKLFVPPGLGYGSNDRTEKDENGNDIVVIPANSILIFDLDLLEVK